MPAKMHLLASGRHVGASKKALREPQEEATWRPKEAAEAAGESREPLGSRFESNLGATGPTWGNQRAQKEPLGREARVPSDGATDLQKVLRGHPKWLEKCKKRVWKGKGC